MRNPGHTSLGAAYKPMASASANLVAGTATFNGLFVDQSSVVIAQRAAVAGAPGQLAEAAVTPGNPGSFIVNSSNAGDTSSIIAYLFQGAGLKEKFTAQGPGFGASAAAPLSRAGTAVLAAGTVVVDLAALGILNKGNLRAILMHKTRAGTAGHLSYAIGGDGVTTTTLTITSDNALDTSTVTWIVFNVDRLGGHNPIGSGMLGTAYPALQYRRVTLVAGTATEITTRYPSTSKTGIILQRLAPGGVLGFLSVGNVTAGNPGSVVVNSSDAGDTSVVDIFTFSQAMFA